jgi:hypothetical protein
MKDTDVIQMSVSLTRLPGTSSGSNCLTKCYLKDRSASFSAGGQVVTSTCGYWRGQEFTTDDNPLLPPPVCRRGLQPEA